jgi:nucleotidyltransferase-like protein
VHQVTKALDDEPLWIERLADRNLTTHTYHQERAERIFGAVWERYAAAWCALANAGFVNTASTTQAQFDAATAQLATQASTTNANLPRSLDDKREARAAAQPRERRRPEHHGADERRVHQATNLANALAAGTTNANNLTGANTASSTLANQVALANASAQTTTSNSNANLGTQAATQNAQAKLARNAQNSTNVDILTQNSLTASGQAVTAGTAQTNAQVQLTQAQAAKAAAVLGARSSIAAALIKSPSNCGGGHLVAVRRYGIADDRAGAIAGVLIWALIRRPGRLDGLADSLSAPFLVFAFLLLIQICLPLRVDNTLTTLVG